MANPENWNLSSRPLLIRPLTKRVRREDRPNQFVFCVFARAGNVTLMFFVVNHNEFTCETLSFAFEEVKYASILPE